MNGECYFCHGLVLAAESDHIVLSDHADHTVFVHQTCAIGNDIMEETADTLGGTRILCPECGEPESL